MSINDLMDYCRIETSKIKRKKLEEGDNRTIVELKLWILDDVHPLPMRFNRTIVELKLKSDLDFFTSSLDLIGLL